MIAQTRIAVLPFQNMDGKLERNIWCYKLQDSLTNALKAKDPDCKYFKIVPSDSIEQILAGMNLDPNNPQYLSDMWKAVKILNIEKVISGNFNIQADRYLINAYIYEVRTRMAVPDYQARDIFKSEENIMESIPMIVKRIIKGLITE